MFRAFSSLGLEQILVRDIVQEPEPSKQNEIVSTAFVLKLIGGVLAVIVSISAIIYLRPDERLSHSLVAIIALGMIFRACDAIDGWFQSQVQSKYSVIAKDIALLIIALFKIVLIQLKAPLIAFAWIALIEIILAGIGLIIVYRVNGYVIKFWQFNRLRAKKLLKDAFPMMLSGVAIMIYMRIDQVMLGEMANSRLVGIYSAAVKLSEAWFFIPIAIANSIFPSIIDYRKISQELFNKKIQSLFYFMVCLSYSMIIPLTIFSNKFINIILGKNYAEASLILSIHVWSGLFVALGIVRTLWLVSENLTLFSLITTSLGAVINIGLNLWLIPYYQAVGAAISTIIAYAIAALFSGLILNRTRPITYMMFKSIVLQK